MMELTKAVAVVEQAQEAGSSEPWTGYLLNQAAAQIRERTGARLAILELTPPMLRVLESISNRQPMTQVQLGASVRMDRTTIVHVLDHLEALTYAKRTPDPTDRRSHAVTLTTRGEAVLAEARRLARDAEDECLTALSPSERKQLNRLLQKLQFFRQPQEIQTP